MAAEILPQEGKTTAQPTSIAAPATKPLSATPYNTPAFLPSTTLARRHIHGSKRTDPQSQTPGNTPSSLEKIGRRLADNLLVSGGGGSTQTGNRIAPSFE